MEKANKKVIVFALILSLITAALVYTYITGNTTTAAPEIEYSTVYVAAKTIPARSKLTSADVTQVKIAKELLSPSAVTDINEINGKRNVESIIAGEQIIKERLYVEDELTLTYNIPEGMRAVTINVNEQSDVAHLVRPGDFVDIVVNFEGEVEDNGQIAKHFPRMTKVTFQNIQVLAMGQDMTLPVDKLAEVPATVTLAIKTEEVEKFIYAADYSSLRLVLRPVDDHAIIETPGIIRGDMTGTKGVYTRPSGSTTP